MKKVVIILVIVCIVLIGYTQNLTKENESQRKQIKQLNDQLTQEKALSDLNEFNNTFVHQTPTPPAQTSPHDTVLPAWRKQVIDAWMAQGYSRATTNQLMKKDNPRCT